MSHPTVGAATVTHLRPGDGAVIEILGIHLEWRVREADSGGHYCVLEMSVPPGAGVPLHEHAQQETFYMAEGRIDFARLVDGKPDWFAVDTRDCVVVPPWTMHGFRNPTGALARVNLTCSAGLEPFFDEAGLPVPRGAPLPRGALGPADIERVVRIAEKNGQRFAPFEPDR